MVILNKTSFTETIESVGVLNNNWDRLPEKVLQFGTGVLLRGLPDYFIDKANRQGVFNGRIAVVKSTEQGSTDEFFKQDGLYTLQIKGIQGKDLIQESIIISSISRVLTATEQWKDILEVGISNELEIIISNTTEVGIVLDRNDDLNAIPPKSFPAKLTAILYKRFLNFGGDQNKGLVILPTELIGNNGAALKEIVLELSELHELGADFISWLNSANYFCNTLVDRIVPGKLSILEKEKIEEQMGYRDELAIMAEPFNLWAIESDNPKVAKILSFAKVNDGTVIAASIWKFKELKLRLLNGSHTFLCGLAILSGFPTVKEAMENKYFSKYLNLLMTQEIIPTIVGEDISEDEASGFASHVVDRFSNPFLDHKWLSISLNYSSKMQMRNIDLIEGFAKKMKNAPRLMALGFAAYILFMKCELSSDGRYIGNSDYGLYTVNDDQASLFSELWGNSNIKDLVNRVLMNHDLWHTDLNDIPGFAETVEEDLKLLLDNGVIGAMQEVIDNKII